MAGKDGKDSNKREYKIVKINDEGKDLAPNSDWGNINKLLDDGWEFHELLGWNVNAGWGHVLFRRGWEDEGEGSSRGNKKGL